jgi:hypothetical protein
MRSFSISVFVILLSQFCALHLTASCPYVCPVFHENCLVQKNIPGSAQQSSYERIFPYADEISCSWEDDSDGQYIRKSLSYSSPFTFLQFQSGCPDFLNVPGIRCPVSTEKLIILQSVLRI